MSVSSSFNLYINDPNKIMVQLVNETLINLNSRYILTDILDKSDFINFIMSFVLEYDVIGEFLEKLNDIFKNFIIINFNNLFNIFIDEKKLETDLENAQYKTKQDFSSKDKLFYKNFIEKLNSIEINFFLKSISGKEDIRSIFNRLNLKIKALKRQADNFVNLSFKLNELIKTQEKPLKYISYYPYHF